MVDRRDEEYCNYKKIVDINEEITNIREVILANMNERLIGLESAINCLDIRTSIFIPKRID